LVSGHLHILASAHLQLLPHQNIGLLIGAQHKGVAAKLGKTFAFIKTDGFVIMLPNAQPYVANFLSMAVCMAKSNRCLPICCPWYS
jgi:hypothetical protein